MPELSPIAASCCRPFAMPSIWIIGWSSSAIAAPTLDAEAHAILLDIVIPKQTAVVTIAELVGALPGRYS
jgi:hypothetical protein